MAAGDGAVRSAMVMKLARRRHCPLVERLGASVLVTQNHYVDDQEA
jgi:hypothetical protein